MNEAPYSAACERNKQPILERLHGLLANCRSVLEVGSGTAQHAVHFAAGMPWLQWTCSDLDEAHAGIRVRIDQCELDNIRGPLRLDARGPWPKPRFDAVFTANTLHIMPFDAVEALFAGVASLLRDGRFVVYGPFHYSGEPTSASNAAFDAELRSRGGGEGIRDVETVQLLAAEHGFNLIADMAMPANNRLLTWEKTA